MTLHIISQDIKKYIELEEEIALLVETLKKRRDEKNAVQCSITEKMKEANILNKTINAGNYLLSVVERKQFSTLSFSFLKTHMAKFIENEAELEYVITYLKENREVKTTSELKMQKKI